MVSGKKLLDASKLAGEETSLYREANEICYKKTESRNLFKIFCFQS